MMWLRIPRRRRRDCWLGDPDADKVQGQQSQTTEAEGDEGRRADLPKDPNFGGGRAGISTSIERAAGAYEVQTPSSPTMEGGRRVTKRLGKEESEQQASGEREDRTKRT